MRSKAHRKGDRLIESVVSEVFLFIKQPLCSPRLVNSATAGLNEERSCRETRPLPDSHLVFYMFCQKSRQPVNSKTTRKLGMPAAASRDGTTPRPSYPYGIKAGGTMTE